ncbi:hypothetical protein YC2023_096558 [Brassica napus]
MVEDKKVDDKNRSFLRLPTLFLQCVAQKLFAYQEMIRNEKAGRYINLALDNHCTVLKLNEATINGNRREQRDFSWQLSRRGRPSR